MPDTMFEKASKLKLRFDTPRGLATTEDLWDIPLVTKNKDRFSLDTIAKEINREMKLNDDESFVEVKTPTEDLLDLKLSIVKHIIKVKLDQKTAAEKYAEKMALKKKISNIIADKQDESLKGQSLEDLQAMLKDL